MNLVAVIPVITTAVRLGIQAGAALAGHPSTKLHGFLIDGYTGIQTPATLDAVVASKQVDLVVVPQVALLRRLRWVPPQCVIEAEILCRIWGSQSWCTNPYGTVVPNTSGRSMEQARECLAELAANLTAIDGLVTHSELATYRSHGAINQRGIPVDLVRTRSLSALIEAREAQRRQDLGSAIQDSNCTVTDALRPGGMVDRLLSKDGLSLRSRSEDALIEVMESGRCSPSVQAMMHALIGHGRITKSKVASILDNVDDDGRLRHQFVLWAARTWRFSSQGTQVQNLPRPPSGLVYSRLDEVLASGADFARFMSATEIDDVLPALLRMVLSPQPGKVLAILDWNAIEPRIRAWLSDDGEHLEAWRSGRDLYSELISSIIGRDVTKATDPKLRNVGKLADIGCGYNMGYDSFNDLCLANGVKLDALGLSSKTVVTQYRRKYWRLADRDGGLWAKLQQGAMHATAHGAARVGKVEFERTTHGHLDMVLPNGSRRRWWNATVQMCTPTWASAGDHSQDAPGLVVANYPGGKPDQVMYGGRILENACQAIARELLTGLINTLEGAGLHVVAHCHDEVVVEASEQEASSILGLMTACAQQPPVWAGDLPLKVEAFVSECWSKEEARYR